MSEATDIPPGTYTLELGSTFTDRHPDALQYHTLRYDFKPKSVAAADSETYIAYGGNGDVHVAVPGENDNLTVFKGSKKEAKPKECLLFFDKKTGRVRLEKITSNMNVKKTRDLDKGTEQVLRQEMSRLRTTSKPAKEEASVPANIDDSSSSSSSSDSDSDTDSDNDDNSPRKRSDSHSSTSDMETQLLATVNGTQSAPPAPLPAIFNDDMPDMDRFSINTRRPAPPPKNTHGDLGLNLSESSDDDD